MATKADGPVHGQLRVWHVPQVAGPSFVVDVATVLEAVLLLDALANYDSFQFENRIKPDYSNAAGLSVFDANDSHDGPDGSWVDWYSDEGEDVDYYPLSIVRAKEPKWEGIRNSEGTHQ